MTRPKNRTAPPGPSAALVSRIDHLTALLWNLPASIPLDPSVSKYSFVLDPEKVEDRAGDAKEIWAYDDLGEKWGTGGRVPQETVGNE